MATKADKGSKSRAADPKHLICTNTSCRHPKSFHKDSGCSAFGCKCEVKPGSRGKFAKIAPKKD